MLLDFLVTILHKTAAGFAGLTKTCRDTPGRLA